MRIDINMTNEEHKLHIASWWASSPEYVLAALQSHLKAAKLLWPAELGGFAIGTTEPQPSSDAASDPPGDPQ